MCVDVQSTFLCVWGRQFRNKKVTQLVVLITAERTYFLGDADDKHLLTAQRVR